ncbi:glycosyltransferase [Salinisphaera hydrothermalis]|uniref:Glycosyltransferase n=1 Tax=Salinisphaera hydrothermalis (strain C41B8) TaxID=1304275 RepID=A0A084IP50_SALHC|nr:glycosyltransferase [Salinisphaera hydrothermalis]KEZ78484.1 glycosyltransferase [Salinisphaera hydrothermalis C41B8]
MSQQFEHDRAEERERIAFFVPSLTGGGVQRIALVLAGAFAREGHPVDLLVTRSGGDYADALPPGVTLHVLKPGGLIAARRLAHQCSGLRWNTLLRPVMAPLRASRILRHIEPLAEYLRGHRPAALVAGMSYPNLVALWARTLSGVDTRVIVVEHNTLSKTLERAGAKWRWRHLPAVLRAAYPCADHVLAVSHGVAHDVAATTGLSPACIETVYNPVVTPELYAQAAADVSDPWIDDDGPPLIVGVGRFAKAKRFDLLIEAFARVRRNRPARLLLLGDGRDRGELEAQIARLGLTQDVRMPGFARNPYAYLARAAVFVLSSDYEGLPTVLIEALACGATVVSTDCPSGPREILDDGRYGRLVPCGDVEALAEGILDAIATPADAGRQRQRADVFSLESSMQRYRQLCVGPG